MDDIVGESMTLIISLFKKVLRFPVIWIGAIYLFWLMFVPLDESFATGIRLLGIYFVIIVLETLLGTNKVLSLALFIVLLPVAGVASILALDFWLSTAGWLGSEFIYIPLIILFSSYNAYNLFQKPPSENKILHILLFITTLPILAINIAYSVSYFPEVIDQKEFNNFKYYIVWGMDIDYRSHLSFYKCEQWSIKCDDPYRDYSQLNFDKIIIDKEKNEASAVRSVSDLGLAFTYGENSRRYEGHPERLGEHVYQLAIDDHAFGTCVATSCDIYTYTLYECDFDYTSCNPLPIQYSTTYDDVIILSANEITNEINAFNGEDTLIFTHGEHPQCYVEGCEILKQK